MQFQVDTSTKKLLFCSVLCGVALALSLIDMAISSLLPFLPGIKLGLANIVSLFVLYTLGGGWALLISIVKSLLTALLSGNITMLFFSLAGGTISILIMWVLINKISLIKTSVLGGLTHNIMQSLVAVFVTATPEVVYYLPVLTIAGAVSGFIMGILCKLLLGRLHAKPAHQESAL